MHNLLSYHPSDNDRQATKTTWRPRPLPTSVDFGRIVVENLEANNRSSLETQKQANLELLKTILFEKEPERAIPEFMADPITKKIMKDPVIIPSGNSYERETLESFMKINGCIDPTNR